MLVSYNLILCVKRPNEIYPRPAQRTKLTVDKEGENSNFKTGTRCTQIRTTQLHIYTTKKRLGIIVTRSFTREATKISPGF